MHDSQLCVQKTTTHPVVTKPCAKNKVTRQATHNGTHLCCHHTLRFGPERGGLQRNEFGLLANSLLLLPLPHNMCVCVCGNKCVRVYVRDSKLTCVHVNVCICSRNKGITVICYTETEAHMCVNKRHAYLTNSTQCRMKPH